jgi:hypothetical protein
MQFIPIAFSLSLCFFSYILLCIFYNFLYYFFNSTCLLSPHSAFLSEYGSSYDSKLLSPLFSSAMFVEEVLFPVVCFGLLCWYSCVSLYLGLLIYWYCVCFVQNYAAFIVMTMQYSLKSGIVISSALSFLLRIT